MTGRSFVKAGLLPTTWSGRRHRDSTVEPVCTSLANRRWTSARHTTMQWTEGSTSTSSKVCPTLNRRPTSGFKSTPWIALSGPKRWLPPAPPPHWRRRSRSLRAGSLVWVPRTGEVRKSELTFPRPILLASSRLRLPVQTSEPARRLKVSEEDCLESEDIQLILSVSIVEWGKPGNYPCSQPESSTEDKPDNI